MAKKWNPNTLLAAAILALGGVLMAAVLGQNFKNIRQAGLITVKGLAEVEHQATLATWNIQLKHWHQHYPSALEQDEILLAEALQFLRQQGFREDEWQLGMLSIQPHMEYELDANGREHSRQNGYNATRSINIRSHQLQILAQAVDAAQKLRAQNQHFDFDAPEYFLENLERIKRDLIAQATQDAYVRAQEFAKTSGVRVGVLHSAAQGSFDIQSITPSSASNSDYGGGYDTSSIQKKVRLVVTIQYGID